MSATAALAALRALGFHEDAAEAMLDEAWEWGRCGSTALGAVVTYDASGYRVESTR